MTDVAPADDGCRDSAVRQLARRLAAFRSLGDNCEFGFAQRYGGVEPSGLLRFAYTPLPDLVRGLDCGFRDFGSPGDLSIEKSADAAYYCRSLRYGIWSNTGYTAGQIEPEILLQREYGRLSHLKTKMLDELRRGSQILVRKVGHDASEADLARLAAAVWNHGPSIVLRVGEAGADWRRSPVRWIGDRLMEGSVRRFAPVERAWDVDLQPWIRLTDTAYALAHSEPPTPLARGTFPDAERLPRRLRRHAAQTSTSALTPFTRAVETARFETGQLYTFSAWVWVPKSFRGKRVFAVAGLDRGAWQDADLSKRRCWQQVWAAGRMNPTAEREPVGLGLIGTRGDHVWSVGARFSKGPVPPLVELPPVLSDLLRVVG